MENIREHMRQQESVQEEINRQKVELSKQAARIRSQITYERKADLRPAVAALETSIRECAALSYCSSCDIDLVTFRMNITHTLLSNIIHLQYSFSNVPGLSAEPECAGTRRS